MSELNNKTADRIDEHQSPTAVPIDAESSRGITSGNHWKGKFHSREMPPISPISVREIQRRQGPRPMGDLTHDKLGLLTVVGLSNFVKGKMSRWIVRCNCGCYEFRIHKTWDRYKRRGYFDACDECLPSEARAKLMSNCKDAKPSKRFTPSMNVVPADE